MFITFEGPEGCGKSTHIKLIKEYLENKGLSVVLTREPGATPNGEKIREILLHSIDKLDSISELCLFEADRAENVTKVILPNLKAGKIVISDRYVDSTVSYQIGGRGLAEDMVRYLNMLASKGLEPDLTILLDISPEVGLKRASVKGKADNFEKENMEFHRKVRAKFLEIAKNSPRRVVVINSEETIDKVQDKIRKAIDAKL